MADKIITRFALFLHFRRATHSRKTRKYSTQTTRIQHAREHEKRTRTRKAHENTQNH